MDDSTVSQESNPFLSPVEDGLPMRDAGQWAIEKLDYLRRYLEIFTTSMRQKNWRGLHFIDLFSGPGKCKVRKTQQFFLGSPLLAITTRHPFGRYFFADMDEVAINALQNRCNHSAQANNVYYKVGDSNKIVTEIVDQIKEHDRRSMKGQRPSLNLAFLDPEGFELEWSTVAALAEVNRMDLIIYYPQMGLKREMPNDIQNSPPTKIDKYFGGIEWREIYQKSKSGGNQKIHRALLDLYEKKLGALGYVKIEENVEPLMRNTSRNAPLYRLIFASKNPLGNKFWQQVTKRDVYGQKKLFE